MKLEIDGLEELEKDLATLADRYGKAATKAAIEVGQMIRTDAIKSIQDQTMGTYVTRHRAGGAAYQHIASKPGAAPNTDTGRLVASIQVDIKPDLITVGTSLDYGRYLEYGGKTEATGSPNYARPWLNPAVEKNRAAFDKITESEADKVTEDFNR